MAKKRRQKSRNASQAKDDPQPADSKRPGIAKFLHRSKTVLLSGIVAVIIAVLLLFRDALVGELFRTEAIGDGIREAEGKPAIQVVRVERFKMDDEHREFVRPDGDTLNPQDEEAVKDLATNDNGDAILARAEAGGVPVQKATWRFFLRGGRNQGVRIIDMRLIGLKREQPLGGTLFLIPPQGGAGNELMGVNGDDVQPTVRKLMVSSGGIDSYLLGRPYFQERTISLNDREDQIIMLRMFTKKYDVSFSLEIDYQVGDQRLTQILNDNGKPFHVTALKCVDGALDYQHYYSLQAKETYGAYPEKPDGNYCD